MSVITRSCKSLSMSFDTKNTQILKSQINDSIEVKQMMFFEVTTEHLRKEVRKAHRSQSKCCITCVQSNLINHKMTDRPCATLLPFDKS